jgi:hypothetical protein
MRATIPSIDRHARRRAGIPKKTSSAKTAPPPSQPPLRGKICGYFSEATAAVVPTVKTTVPLVPSVIWEPAPPPEQVAPSPPVAVVDRSWQVRVTIPVYPATAATVTVAVAEAPGAIPVVVPAAAGAIAGAGLLMVKVDDMTVTFAEPVADW